MSATPGPAQIRNSNGPMLAAMVEEAGGEPLLLPITPDDAAALDAVLSQARTADMLLITGGVSAGKFDLVEPALARAGAVSISLACAFSRASRSCLEKSRKQLVEGQFRFLACRAIQYLRPLRFCCLLRRCWLRSQALTNSVRVLCLRNCAGPQASRERAGLPDFFRPGVRLARTENLPSVALVSWQGSGDIAAMARANCFLVLDDDSTHPEPGATVRILLS